jgi:putative hemin transport protein
METVNANLKEQYAELKEQKMRIRDAAKQLGVSEAELVALGCGETATRLRPEFEAILGKAETLGFVMALSRNDEVVHERKGVYENGSFGPHASLFVGPDIDLRIFLSAWASAFAVNEQVNDKPRYSLQFFGKDGQAVHKIYIESRSNEEAYHAIVNEFKAEDQSPEQNVERKEYTPENELSDADIDVKAFQQAWLDLKDTHEFFGMLRTHKVTRTQALRLAPGEYYAQKISNNGLRKALTLASATETPIMVFVGNPGIIQIHTGTVKNIVDHGPWINVLDPMFNLHLKEGAIAESWVVRKPTTDGVVTSLELFNERKELICTLFGERKPGKAELEAWRNIAAELN